MATDDGATHGRKPKPNEAIELAIKACVDEGDFDGAAELIDLRRRRGDGTRAAGGTVVLLATRKKA